MKKKTIQIGEWFNLKISAKYYYADLLENELISYNVEYKRDDAGFGTSTFSIPVCATANLKKVLSIIENYTS